MHAAVARLTVQDSIEPFETVIWYPTDTAEAPWQAGPYPVAATRGAPIREGQRFPVVLLSHGEAGTPWAHAEFAQRLARQGFIVVVPTHVGDASGHAEAADSGRALIDRPRQARLALAAALADPRFAEHAEAARIGMVGYSAGAVTALILAGARPDFARAAAYCRDVDDVAACGRREPGMADRRAATFAAWRPDIEPKLKALVLLDPPAVMFDRAGLAAVRLPVLLVRAQDDSLMPATGRSPGLLQGLPAHPKELVVPGRHYVFLDPCPPSLAELAPEVCEDGSGVDRSAVHAKLDPQISAFLRARL